MKKNINNTNYETELMIADFDNDIQTIKQIADGSSDLLINKIIISGIQCALICYEGMVSTATITQLVLHPLMEINLPSGTSPQELYEHIDTKMLMTTDKGNPKNYGDFFRFVMSGFALIIIDGIQGAFALGIQGYITKSISEPSNESNIKGSHEGFVEIIRSNMSLIRRRIKSATLKFELYQIGKRSKTDICLAYLTDKVPQSLIKNIKKQIDKIDLDLILSSGYVEPFLEGDHLSIFSSAGTTERPDVLCAKILEGRVALLVDGTPFVIVIPYLFIENFQTLDDYSSRPFYATYIRWIKYFALFLSTMLPGLYVAIITFHPELFNHTLLTNLAVAEEFAPFSLFVEAIFVLLMYEILREAGLRLPKGVGGSVSLIGGFIIGDAAVSSGLISTPLLIVVALSVTASFIIPNLNQPVTVLRLVYIIAGGFSGLFGISIVLAVTILNICAIDNFGFPALSPIFPLIPKSLRDTLIRLGFKKLQEGDVSIEKLKGVHPN